MEIFFDQALAWSRVQRPLAPVSFASDPFY